MSLNISFSDYYKPKAKQLQAHRCKAKYVLFGGAMGGGKSWFLCADAIINAMRYPGNRLAIIRKELSVARQTIIVTFLSICPSEIIARHNQSSCEVTFVNGSKLIFKEANIRKDPLLNKIKGLEIGWAGIDEANEIHQNVFAILKSRLRWVCPDGTVPNYRIRLTSNPENCWLVPTFIEGRDPLHVFIQSLTTDNYDKDSEYVKQLTEAYKHNPELLKRYLGGEWSFGSTINQLIRSELIAQAMDSVEDQQGLTMGVDVARYGDDHTCFAIIEDGNLRLLETWSKTSIVDVANRTLALAQEFGIPASKIGVDVVGIGAGVVDTLHEIHGFMVVSIVAGEKPVPLKKQEVLAPANLRAQMAMELRDDIADKKFGGLAACEYRSDTDKSASELQTETKNEISYIRYKIQSGKKLIIWSKEEMKKEFGKSPDKGDAIVIANWMRKRHTSKPAALPISGGGSFRKRTNQPQKKRGGKRLITRRR